MICVTIRNRGYNRRVKYPVLLIFLLSKKIQRTYKFAVMCLNFELRNGVDVATSR